MSSLRFTRSTAVLLVALFGLPLVSGCFLFPRRTVTPGVAAGGTGSLSGTVRYMATHEPAVGVSVTLFGSNKVVAVTDAQGRFGFPSLPTGWQGVYASKEGFVLAGAAVRLSPGQKATVSLDLQTLTGHLHAADSRVPQLCGSCHILHREPLMLGGSNNAPCFGCHQGDYPNFSNNTIYSGTLHSASQAADSGTTVKLHQDGKARGDCTNCHEPHGINNSHIHLLIFASAESSNPLCYSCHVSAGTGHTADYPGQAACEATDNPHMNPTSSRQDLLTIYPNSQAQAGECYNCHNPHGATRNLDGSGGMTTAMTRAEGTKLCTDCHTYLAPTMAVGSKHACSFCHNPHEVGKGGVVMVKKPGVATGELVPITTYYGTHRGVVNQLTNAYCLGCHNNNAGNPYAGRAKTPDLSGTGFRNITTAALPNANYRDLHAVHVTGPIGEDDGLVEVDPNFYAGDGYRKYNYRECYPGGYHNSHGQVVPKTAENKVWCIDCHDVHPHLPSAGNTRGHLLKTNLITTATVTSNINGTGYNNKGGCSMNTALAACHKGASRDGAGYTGCDWCHGPGGSPGYACDCTDKTCPPRSYSGTKGSGGTYGFHHGLNHYDSPGITNRRPVVL